MSLKVIFLMLITIGQAVYTSNFTTPTKPALTSQSVTSSNVKLLCCKDKFDEIAVIKFQQVH